MTDRRLLAVLLMLLAAAPAAAHNLELTDTLVVLKTDGTYQVDMTCDLDALALGASPTTDSAELAAALGSLAPAELEARVDRLRRTFERRVRVLFDDRPARPAVSFPDFGTPIASEAAVPTVLGLTARLEGRIPEGAREMTFRASRSFPPVHLTVLDQASATGARQLLELGGTSEPVRLGEPLAAARSAPPGWRSPAATWRWASGTSCPTGSTTSSSSSASSS